VAVDVHPFVANPPEEPPEWMSNREAEEWLKSRIKVPAKITYDAVLTLDNGRKLFFRRG